MRVERYRENPVTVNGMLDLIVVKKEKKRGEEGG